jgi:pectate lyase
MKKGKMMLAAIAVLAIVGGALAFKAKNAFQTQVFTSTKSGNGCTTPEFSTTGGSSGAEVYYTTQSPTCITTSTTLQADTGI